MTRRQEETDETVRQKERKLKDKHGQLMVEALHEGDILFGERVLPLCKYNNTTS